MRTGYIEKPQTVYSPLALSDGKLEEVEDGWGYNIDMPRLPAVCPLYVGGLDDFVAASPSGDTLLGAFEDYWPFRESFGQISPDAPQTGASLNLHHLYERLRDKEQDMLRSLLLACLPNLNTLDYQPPWDHWLLCQTVSWAATHYLEGNSKHTAFRNLRKVRITKITDREQNLLPIIAAFMGLPNITTVSASGVRRGYYERDSTVAISQVTDLKFIDHDVSCRDLEELLDGGKPLKTFRSITNDWVYIHHIGKVLSNNARSSLEILELSKLIKNGTARKQGFIHLHKFARLREVTIEYSYLVRYTRDSRETKLADVLPHSLEALTLKTEGPTEVLFSDLVDLLHQKSRRVPMLRKLDVHAFFIAAEYKHMALRKACREGGVSLSLFCGE